MKKHLTYIALFLLFFSCKPEKNLDEFQFLAGTWEGQRDGMTIRETWKKENNLLSGEGVVLAGTDTAFHEKFKLEIRESEIFYVATVPNNPGPVSFKLVKSNENQWTFENKQHDFPQEITYHLIKPDSLDATISGDDKGKTSKEEFHFKKVM